jgi:hypothetical protein
MPSYNQHIQLSSPDAFLLLIIFLLIFIVLISWSQRSWKKLVSAFGSSINIPWNQKNNATIQINGRKFRAVVLISEKGLSLSQYGLLPRLMLTKQALIPWGACSSIYKKETKALGMSFTQFFVDVSANGEQLQIMLPSNIGLDIIKNRYKLPA